MRVQKITQNKISFGHGLADVCRVGVENAKRIGCKKIAENLKNMYGINAEFNGATTPAYCVEQVAKIFRAAGLPLAKNFKFAPLNKRFDGLYDIESDTVFINALYKHFEDLDAQNLYEESCGIFSPDTGHFLHTYLHEYSHAAHFKNICNINGTEEGKKILYDILLKYSPKNFLIDPITSILKSVCPDWAEGIIDKQFPPKNGLYAKSNLAEYMAEVNARNIAIQLGNSFDKKSVSSVTEKYKKKPYNWNLFYEILTIITNNRNKGESIFTHFFGENKVASAADKIINITKACSKEIDYTNGTIWEGNKNDLIYYTKMHVKKIQN